MRATFHAGGLVLLLALTGCGGSSVAGRWGDDRRADPCAQRRAIEFASDGQIKERGRTVGAWLQNGPTVTATQGESGRAVTLVLDGDTLTMAAQNGRPASTLRRCPN